jgi:glycosyltransferase involved in cell wall biosynthesis
MTTEPRVLIVAEHASARFGGEAVLPLHYYRLLRERGVDVRLIVHERTRDELTELFPEDSTRIRYVADTDVHRALWAVSKRLPRRVGDLSVGVWLRIVTQIVARRLAADWVKQGAVDLIHQPIPVSPKDPSLLFGLGVPVVIGPMNGGMDYPLAFARLETGVERRAVALARRLSSGVHALLRGKRDATTLLVSNERTRRALPEGVRGRVVELVENGVDLRTFDGSLRPRLYEERLPGTLRAIFVGRLVDWKALDVVLEAMKALEAHPHIQLDVLGDGPERGRWEGLSQALGLADRVRFHGFVDQSEVPAHLARADVLVLPSVYECGGAVVLEAMAMGVPAIATAWGGPLDYLDDRCGFLIPPTSRGALVNGFTEAMLTLAQDPSLADSLGQTARERVEQHFDWRKKIEIMLGVYREAVERYALASA